MSTKYKYWFRAKNYGWRWYPVTWQGWLATGTYLLVILLLSFRLPDDPDLEFGFLVYRSFAPLTVFTIILIFICYKTGERPEWRWGGKKLGKK